MNCPQSTSYPNLLIGIGGSAGVLQPLIEILDLLSFSFQGAVLVATHRATDTPNELPNILQRYTRLRVSEPLDNERLHCTHVYVGQPDEILKVSGREIDLQFDPERVRRLQRIDDLFISIAESAGENAVGIILSGALSDGIEGLKHIKRAGGTCLVQSPDNAKFECMPRNALESIDCDLVGTPLEIASFLIELAAGRSCK